MAKRLVLPIFPLGMAVLPGESFPLYIFEPSYVSLLRYCQGGNTGGAQLPFAIVRVKDGELATRGCSVVIQKVVHQFSDGRALVIARGEHRLEICQVIRGSTFSQAEVECLNDGSVESWETSQNIVDIEERQLRDGVWSLFTSYSSKGGSLAEDALATLYPFSFRVAVAICVDMGEKQAILEASDEKERLMLLREFLSFRISVLEQNCTHAHRLLSNGTIRSTYEQ